MGTNKYIKVSDANAHSPARASARANANRRRNPSLLDDTSLTFSSSPPPGSLRRTTWTRRSSRLCRST